MKSEILHLLTSKISDLHATEEIQKHEIKWTKSKESTPSVAKSPNM